MPQSDPFTYIVPRKMTDSELARALRLDAAAELDAMNLYEAHIEATDNEDARKVLAFIAKDEKEHYALFHELVRRLDPQQAEEMEGIGAKLDTILGAPLGAASESAVDASGEGGGDVNLTGGLEDREQLRQPTIGSLFGQLQS